MDRIVHFDRRTGLHDKTPYVLRGPVPGSNGTQHSTQNMDSHFGIAHGIHKEMLQSFSSWTTSREKIQYLILKTREVQQVAKTCRKATATISLFRRLLDYNPDSLIIKHKVNKRFASAAIGWDITAISGLFMESQIQSLSSSNDHIPRASQNFEIFEFSFSWVLMWSHMVKLRFR